MTTSSQTLTGELPVLAEGHAPAPKLLSQLRQRVAELRCQLHGHDPMLRVDEGRMYLFCPTCQVESPGWRLDQPAPRLRHIGAPDRFDRYSWHTAGAVAVDASH
jgi:hypothetical protein